MTKPNPNAEILANVLQKMDPMELTIMILGGTAAANGIVPPMTRLLLSFVGNDSTAATNIQKDITSATGTLIGSYLVTFLTPWLIPVSSILGWGGKRSEYIQDPLPLPATDDEKKQQSAAVGLFCSGAVEALIMYKLVSNPETFKALISLPGQVVQGVGSLIPPIIPV
jgi:hypothetical protein